MKKVLLISLVVLTLTLVLVSCATTTAFKFTPEPGGKSIAVSSGAGQGFAKNKGDIIIPDSYEIVVANKISVLAPVTSIADRGFQQEEEITGVTIPTSIKTIGSYAFAGCTSLATIRFEGTVAEWKAIKKGRHWNQDVPATEVICYNGTVTLK